MHANMRVVTASCLDGGVGEPLAVFFARDENDSFGSRIMMWSDSAWPGVVRLFMHTHTTALVWVLHVTDAREWTPYTQ